MQRRYNLTHLILASVVALGLTLLMMGVDAEAQIAFVSKRDGNAEIYVMDADGGNQRRLTENRNNDRYPVWSPDGQRIAFMADRKGNFEQFDIYVMDADGGNLQNRTNHPDDDWNPTWLHSPFSVSPVGKQFTMWGWLKGVDR